jgi:tRNA pseudouridine55 synthase
MTLPDNLAEGTVFLVDKPLKWTSFDVVNKIRYRMKQRLGQKNVKVGHAGTLDPLATGLLIICTGKMTKEINTFMAQEKTYTGTITLGGSTPSYDLETEIDHHYPTAHIDPKVIEAARLTFVGDIMQKPPMYSAIKVDGKKLYESARAGEVVEVKSRAVSVFDFEVGHLDLLALPNGSAPSFDFMIRCSKGTYIRTIAHDFGQVCGSGSHLSKLCRTAIGDYQLKDAWNLDDLIRELEA